jgi:hypothetical protein
MQAGLSVYALSGEGWQGFILGGDLCVHEDDADFAAPSALLRERHPERPPGFASETDTKEAPLPMDHEIEAAAHVLFKEGSFHHWWPTFKKSYDEFVATDPIGKDEFDGIVERILFAAFTARLDKTP